MRAARAAALAAFLVAACEHGDAPRCRRDQDCGPDHVCEPAAGICVRMTTPLDLDASNADADADAGADASSDAAPEDGLALDSGISYP